MRTHVGADTLDNEIMMRNRTQGTSHGVTACDAFKHERVLWIPVGTLNACMHRMCTICAMFLRVLLMYSTIQIFGSVDVHQFLSLQPQRLRNAQDIVNLRKFTADEFSQLHTVLMDLCKFLSGFGLF